MAAKQIPKIRWASRAKDLKQGGQLQKETDQFSRLHCVKKKKDKKKKPIPYPTKRRKPPTTVAFGTRRVEPFQSLFNPTLIFSKGGIRHPR